MEAPLATLAAHAMVVDQTIRQRERERTPKIFLQFLYLQIHILKTLGQNTTFLWVSSHFFEVIKNHF
jgi:hypothetical protein